jgi:hypothetical protein
MAIYRGNMTAVIISGFFGRCDDKIEIFLSGAYKFFICKSNRHHIIEAESQG